MKRTVLIISIFLLHLVGIYANDLDVSVSIPQDYGIDFPEGLHLDRLYLAMENPAGELELLTESDIFVGLVHDTFGSVNLCLLYYGNLSQPYSVQLVIDAGEGFCLVDSTLGVFTIPVLPQISLPRLISLTEGNIILSAEENKANLVINPTGPVRGERVADIALNWNGGRNLLPGVYTAEISMVLISE